ncbi:hypothetical protein [Streptomyces rubellomurinus]|uniref:Asp23/Gls24 family envelope stress response protein n=2 Tax=Streptomyces TaxID=1883 RepID=A0A0F2TF38_STRR3|nr:hypothetical protein [Streptomyces rubellomurinus]KJS60347.1 hypothetical protein VM95_21655 [Streptomyces rubellomurinus]
MTGHTAAAARTGGGPGRLRIAERVYARIARAAAREALAGVWAGRSVRGAPPRVSVSVPGSTVTVRVEVELPFPADLGALARGVRERVAAQVLGLTGTRVSDVVVVVEKLIGGGAS